MNWIYYCTKKRFATMWRSHDAMEKLMDREYKKAIPHAACQHVWNIAKDEKFVYINMVGWTYRCTACFNENIRKSVQPGTCKELGIPDIEGRVTMVITTV